MQRSTAATAGRYWTTGRLTLPTSKKREVTHCPMCVNQQHTCELQAFLVSGSGRLGGRGASLGGGGGEDTHEVARGECGGCR